MARSKTLHEYNISRLNVLFALLSIVMVVVVVGMVMEDHNRQWKKFQREFRQLEIERLEAAKVEAEEGINQKRLDKALEKVAEADSLLDEHEDEIARIDDELVAVGGVWYRRDQDYRFLKAEYDVVKYNYQVAENEHDEAKIERLAERLRADEAELTRRRLLREQAEATQDSLNGALAEISKDRVKYQDRLEKLTADVDDIEKQLAFLAETPETRALDAPMLDFIAPNLRIRQVIPAGLTYDINFGVTERVDRCQTCHLAIDRPGWEDAPQPYTTHPRLELMVSSNSPHPIDLYGCTECHEGRPRGVEFSRAAHNPVSEEQEHEWVEEYGFHELHHWQWPMLRKGSYETSCQKCHTEERLIPGAEVYNRGRDLVEYYGCYACHKIDTYNDLPKTGPSLLSVAEKITPEFAYRWINDPKNVRPHSVMPQLFNLDNVVGGYDGDATYWQRRTRAEINGIIAYLWEHSNDTELTKPLVRGDPINGELLFEKVGCQACHYVGAEQDENAEPWYNPRMFGPNLEGVGSKTSQEWLYNWIMDPKTYDPTTRMPDLRLREQEGLDITAYLMGLTAEETTPYKPGPSDPEMVDEVLTDYLTNTQSFATAAAQLAPLDAHQREVLLGERIIGRQGCFGCHDIEGFENTLLIGTDLSEEGSKPLSRFDFGNQHQIPHAVDAWLTHKMLYPRSFDEGLRKAPVEKARMPYFAMTDEQADAVVMNIMGWTKDTVPPGRKVQYTPAQTLVNQGEKLVAQRNCRACHLIEGHGMAIAALIEDSGYWPPNLHNEGAKVQPDWLVEFLHDPSPVRPWLDVRMPTFGFDVQDMGTITGYFLGLAEKTDEPYPLASLRDYPGASDGETYFVNYKCQQCHPAEAGDAVLSGEGEGGGPASASDLAPNLALASRRLRPDWIVDWLRNPQNEMPGTKMPSFFWDDGEYFFDEAPDQMEQIRDYLMTLSR